jgi:hypothetical protein
MRVSCSVEEVELHGDYGLVNGVEATCSRCDHQTQSFGTSAASIRRCMVVMREECPKDEQNFYFDEDEGDRHDAFEPG